MRRLWLKTALLGGALLMLAVPPALAVDMSDTTWNLHGRSRLWARGLGRDFGPMNGSTTTFAADGTFSFAGSAITGTWQDMGGHRFGGAIDPASLEQALEDFINTAAGIADADVTEVRVDRIWGHVSNDLGRVLMKVRVAVWFSSATLGIERRGAFAKLDLRGTLVAGTPSVTP